MGLVGSFGRYVCMTDVTLPGAVLIVEDEPIIRMVAAYGLADDGVVTYEAADAAEALKMLAQHPDITVLFRTSTCRGTWTGWGSRPGCFNSGPTQS